MDSTASHYHSASPDPAPCACCGTAQPMQDSATGWFCTSCGCVTDATQPSPAWLSQFTPGTRTSFGLIFRGEYRAGYRTPQALLARICHRVAHEAKLRARLAHESSRTSIPDQDQAALAYAAWIIQDEQLSPEEREARKATRRPPTANQLKYLYGLGYQGRAPESLAEVSGLIAQLKTEKEVRKAKIRQMFQPKRAQGA